LRDVPGAGILNKSRDTVKLEGGGGGGGGGGGEAGYLLITIEHGSSVQPSLYQLLGVNVISQTSKPKRFLPLALSIFTVTFPEGGSESRTTIVCSCFKPI
jgi:hypothetical protein